MDGQLAMTLVATISDIIFFPPLFFSPPLTTFLIEGVLGSKLDLLKVDPLEAFWILQAMQAVSECPRQHLAGIIF